MRVTQRNADIWHRKLHAQHDARYVFFRDDGSALIAELRLLADYLTEEPQHSGSISECGMRGRAILYSIVALV